MKGNNEGYDGLAIMKVIKDQQESRLLGIANDESYEGLVITKSMKYRYGIINDDGYEGLTLPMMNAMKDYQQWRI